MPTWLVYALLSAACAASIWVFGKIGMREINSDLATAVRSVVQAAFVVTFAAAAGVLAKVNTFSGRPVAIAMVVLSGIAGGLSWIFAFRALQLAQPSQVAPIDKLSVPLTVLLGVMFLGDRPSLLNWAGVLLIAVGAYLTSLPRPV